MKTYNEAIESIKELAKHVLKRKPTLSFCYLRDGKAIITYEDLKVILDHRSESE